MSLGHVVANKRVYMYLYSRVYLYENNGILANLSRVSHLFFDSLLRVAVTLRSRLSTCVINLSCDHLFANDLPLYKDKKRKIKKRKQTNKKQRKVEKLKNKKPIILTEINILEISCILFSCYTYPYTHIHVCIYIYVCVYVNITNR